MGKHFRAIWLFLQIVWRESPGGGRVNISTAWEVSAGLNGLKGKDWGYKKLDTEPYPE